MSERSAARTIIKLSAVILAMYAVFAVALYISYSEMSFDLSKRDADTEYLSILETGGLSGGAHNERNIYKQDGRYYLELKEKHGRDEKYELTKEEYILCTDIDTDYLRDAPRSMSSDSFAYGITVRKNGEEINIPPRDYATQYFGLWRFVRDSRNGAPAGQISYDTYIRYFSYIYSRGTGYSL
ncbi:MAG: hypothetical protein II695_01835, partial [Oscillospiraceae bacterium]|nr:hypothetical protein [Oscillospiraceae bacterium]